MNAHSADTTKPSAVELYILWAQRELVRAAGRPVAAPRD
jgi:hypothetical protein